MKLFKTSVRLANEKFIPMCAGITGEIGSLTVDPNHVPDTTGIPIDILMADLAHYNDENEVIDNDIDEQFAQV